MRGLAVALGLASFIAAPALSQSTGQHCEWRCMADFGPAGSQAYNQCVNARCMHGEGVEDTGASPWSFIDPLMAQSLDIRDGEPPATLFVDHADPTVAQLAFGYHTRENRFGGTMRDVVMGLFARADDGWRYAGPVVDLYGAAPRDPAFLGGRIEITFTTHGPNEPVCCPSQETRWSIDVASRQVTQVR